MVLTVALPEELARRVEAFARAQGVAAETVVVEALERSVPREPVENAAAVAVAAARFGFVALGEGRADLAERHKEIRREHLSAGSAGG